MLQNTKCECGHQNAVGTVLCECCGKPLFDENGTTLLEMRYDGVARRSQRANPSWLDRVWNFFSSVKVAVYLIVFTLSGATLGTFYPQENTLLNVDPAVYYKQTYGMPGELYYRLGLSDTYGSWWFVALLVMIGTSLVICSLDRVLPLYRALSKQQIRKHLNFISRQKVAYAVDLPQDEASGERWVQQIGDQLRKKRYRVYRDGTALLAEKNRFSRWGPYINHIGLIIFLLAVLTRHIPGWHMDQYIGFLEGETQRIPGTPYYLKNEQFTVDFYTPEEMAPAVSKQNPNIPKKFETKAVLYECTANCERPDKQPELKEVTRHDIIVNDPLEYKGLLAYQFDFAMTPQLVAVKPWLKNKQTGENYGQITLRMKNPQERYEAGPYRLQLVGYYPDFALDDKGVPVSKSGSPNAPAFIFTITGPDLPKEGINYLYFALPKDKQLYGEAEINASVGSKLEMSVNLMQTDVQIANYTSYLNIRKDLALPYIWTGAAIFMIGVAMGLYWQHRRIWLRIDGGRLSLGAHTNKNWYGLRGDVAFALNRMEVKVEPKALENEVNRS